MYFTSEIALSARLTALDHYRSASNILLDSTDSLISLYIDAGSKTLDLARSSEALPDAALFQGLLPELVNGHLRIAGQVQENLVRLAEAQMHNANRLTKFTLDKTAHLAPPIVEQAINTAESILKTGESAADELCEASLKAVIAVEKKIGRSSRAKPRASA